VADAEEHVVAEGAGEVCETGGQIEDENIAGFAELCEDRAGVEEGFAEEANVGWRLLPGLEHLRCETEAGGYVFAGEKGL